MGYTHSWEWDDKIADPKKFARWCGDVLVLLAYYNENPPPNPYKEEPWIWFPRTSIPDWNTTICGPRGDCDHPIFQPDIVSFNGHRASDNACEPFVMDIRDLEHKSGSWCKVGLWPL